MAFLVGFSIGDKSVTTAKLADGAVTTIKLADDAVDYTKLGSNSVYSSNIVDGEVTTDDLADSAVQIQKEHFSARPILAGRNEYAFTRITPLKFIEADNLLGITIYGKQTLLSCFNSWFQGVVPVTSGTWTAPGYATDGLFETDAATATMAQNEYIEVSQAYMLQGGYVVVQLSCSHDVVIEVSEDGSTWTDSGLGTLNSLSNQTVMFAHDFSSASYVRVRNPSVAACAVSIYEIAYMTNNGANATNTNEDIAYFFGLAGLSPFYCFTMQATGSCYARKLIFSR